MSANIVNAVPCTAPLELVDPVAIARLPTRHGEFTAHVYRSRLDGVEHMALVAGEINCKSAVLVRLHSECLTGDVFGSLRCDCGEQLDMALQRIIEAGSGVLLYLRGQEGRGIGLAHKIQAYALQDQGMDTVDANTAQGLPIDSRSYDAAAEILRHMGIRSVRLMSNNPLKWAALQEAGLPVTERVVHQVEPNKENRRYLETKRLRMGHMLAPDVTLAYRPKGE